MLRFLLIAPTLTPLLSRLIEQVSTREKWQLDRVNQLSVALEELQTGKYRLVIMSDELGEEGINEVLELIKIDKLNTLSLILIDQKTPIQTKLKYLAVGADEILSQTVGWTEFWLRFQNLLNKERTWLRPARKLADLTHYYQEGLIESSNQKIQLRQKENKILECLTRFQHRVVSKADVMRYVWQNPVDCPSPETIEVYIRRLRLKLGKKLGAQIKTYRGFGYRWEPGD